MKTYEMVALAENNGLTYKTAYNQGAYMENQLRYNKVCGFHYKDVEQEDMFDLDDLTNIMKYEWTLCEKRKMTIEEIEEIVGESVEILGINDVKMHSMNETPVDNRCVILFKNNEEEANVLLGYFSPNDLVWKFWNEEESSWEILETIKNDMGVSCWMDIPENPYWENF